MTGWTKEQMKEFVNSGSKQVFRSGHERWSPGRVRRAETGGGRERSRRQARMNQVESVTGTGKAAQPQKDWSCFCFGSQSLSPHPLHLCWGLPLFFFLASCPPNPLFREQNPPSPVSRGSGQRSFEADPVSSLDLS